MVRLSVAVNVEPRKVQDLLQAFRFLMVGTLLEPGCLGATAWVDPDSTVRYLEEWSTEEDMRRRVLSDRFTLLLGLMESSKERPVVHFDFVAKTRGLDYVEEIRHGVAQ
jgi:quinol monooxygenase YgiN